MKAIELVRLIASFADLHRGQAENTGTKSRILDSIMLIACEKYAARHVGSAFVQLG